MGLKIWDKDADQREKTSAVADLVFKLAEQVLVAGIFGFLAAATNHWAVYSIAIALTLLAGLNIYTTLWSYQFTQWRTDDNLFWRGLWRLVDVLIFGAIWGLIYFGSLAIYEAMRGGVGI